MQGERYFLEIPIYRVSRDRFHKTYDHDLRRHWDRLERADGRTREEMREELRLWVEQHFWETYGSPWQYNQAVGWLRLFVLGSQITGELWMSAAKRLTRKGLRRFQFVGTAFEIHCGPEQSSDDIRTEVEQALERFRKEYRGGRLILDRECFRALAPHIDWCGLIGLEGGKPA